MTRDSVRRWTLLVAGWTIVGLVQALFRSALAETPSAALVDLLRYDLPLALSWAAMTPVVGWWDRRIARGEGSGMAVIAAHLPMLLAVAAANTALRRALVVAAGQSLIVPYSITALYYADLTILAYLIAVWSARVLREQPILERREREAEILQRRLADAQLAHLQQQLRPHFLFNALGTVAELAHEAPAAAKRMLHNVIALLESAVAPRARGEVSVREELQLLQPYLEIQRLRFEDWLELEQEIDPRALDAVLPAFTLQPLIENAVQHGLTRRTERGRIVIRARAESGRLHISVTDNGVGLTSAAAEGGRGMGLSNLRARLETLFEGDASLSLTSLEGIGTGVHLDVPWRDASAAVASDDEDVTLAGPLEPSHLTRSKGLLAWARSHPVAAVVALWCVVGALRIQHSLVYLTIRDRNTREQVVAAVWSDVAAAALWLVATPLALLAIRRVPLVGRGMFARIAFHAGMAFVLAVGLTATSRWITGDTRFPLFSPALSQVYTWNVGVYVVMLAVAHLRAIRRWIAERATAADRLRREIREAHLRQAMLELRPEVLLESLRRVAGRIDRDVRQAEEALARIGDFLRRTLDLSRERTVPLHAEAAAAEAYAGVLALVTEPPLRLRLAIPPASRGREVPNGVLRATLDALAGSPLAGGSEIVVEVTESEGSLWVQAGAAAPQDRSAGYTGELRLAEYRDRGLIDILASDPGGVQLRVLA